MKPPYLPILGENTSPPTSQFWGRIQAPLPPNFGGEYKKPPCPQFWGRIQEAPLPPPILGENKDKLERSFKYLPLGRGFIRQFCVITNLLKR